MFVSRKRLRDALEDAEHNWRLAMAWKRIAEERRGEAERLREQLALTAEPEFNTPVDTAPAHEGEAVTQYENTNH